jgi:hypothetical protein
MSIKFIRRKGSRAYIANPGLGSVVISVWPQSPPDLGINVKLIRYSDKMELLADVVVKRQSGACDSSALRDALHVAASLYYSRQQLGDAGPEWSEIALDH